ncbi:hypothetical protein E0Z10_g1168 [Xylaria hypoxylon]|uniref:Uncharacterized protein n=1 Tax=Xylaria hypoxylon TaxID=37992 RepID=A0A4Z0Z9H0_9PEZI|nr:hypothetical protein E0Z10_g1168 [Xylaria hypoxylon]
MSLTPNVPSGPNTEWHKKQEDLWTALGGFSFEEQDMKYTIEKQERLPSHERAMTEQLVNTPRFREWMVSPMSRQLLIQGNLTGDRQISTLSVFCSTFTSTIRQGLKYITLVHICGLHTDLNRDVDAGPRGMIMSFIAQLLWQWDFDTTFLFENVDLSWFEYGWDPSTKNLCDLLIWMIRQLPSSQTAFFVVDGIHHYEKDVYVIALMESIASILETTLDERVNATVKVLVTSPCRVVETREGFPDDAILLLIESPGTSLDIISSRRLEHQIARTLETS